MFTDKSQKGFARYCPSFARAYDCMIDKLWEVRIKWNLHSVKSGAIATAWNRNLSTPWVLKNLVRDKKSRDMLIPEIVNRLKDWNEYIRDDMKEALEIAAENGNQETLDAVTIAITRLMQSKWFLVNAERNSLLFVELSAACARIMAIIQVRYPKSEAVGASS